ncbi:hypothetical protein GQX74_013267 [Glossina fuscipes]|nr:hypothetical protein GQX74_013267 [Glossina fuscipes]
MNRRDTTNHRHEQRLRQSSEPSISPFSFFCNGLCLNCKQSLTPLQQAMGCGDLNRKRPTGGSAKESSSFAKPKVFNNFVTPESLPALHNVQHVLSLRNSLEYHWAEVLQDFLQCDPKNPSGPKTYSLGQPPLTNPPPGIHTNTGLFAKSTQSLSPDHFLTGTGERKRKRPKGGSAYGMPSKPQ